MAVRVLAPVEAPPPPYVALDGLPEERPLGRLSAAVAPASRVGRTLLGPVRSGVLREIVVRYRPRTVLFTPAYLAAAAPDVGVPVALDFHDLEVGRMLSLAGEGSVRNRAAYGLEALKARRWEPRLARAATVTTATCPADVARLSAWGASPLLVRNGADRHDYRPSPSVGPVTFVASFGYRPNLEAARFLLASVWPRLRRVEPDLVLRLVGRQAATAGAGAGHSRGVEVVSDPPVIDHYYGEASVVVAPVAAGGGAQVKVTEALARNRVVVATPFSARAAPAAAGPGLVVARHAAEFADCVLRLWRDADERWARERTLVERRPVPTWQEACAPLVQALTPLVLRR